MLETKKDEPAVFGWLAIFFRVCWCCEAVKPSVFSIFWGWLQITGHHPEVNLIPMEVMNLIWKAPLERWINCVGKQRSTLWHTLQGTNISFYQGTFEHDFPFCQVGYVSFLEDNGDEFWWYFFGETKTHGTLPQCRWWSCSSSKGCDFGGRFKIRWWERHPQVILPTLNQKKMPPAKPPSRLPLPQKKKHWCSQPQRLKSIHPWRLTWTIIIEIWFRSFSFSKWVICRYCRFQPLIFPNV